MARSTLSAKGNRLGTYKLETIVGMPYQYEQLVQVDFFKYETDMNN